MKTTTMLVVSAAIAMTVAAWLFYDWLAGASVAAGIAAIAAIAAVAVIAWAILSLIGSGQTRRTNARGMPGWYRSSDGRPVQRWWDGRQWTGPEYPI